MCLQSACIRGCIVTLVAFVRLFFSVRFQMCSQITCMRRGIVTLVAFVWHFSTVSTKCKQCDYASSDASNLRRHLKTHSGEKPIRCYQCDFAFSQAEHLRRHLKTHSGVKPNKCTQCDFASSQAGQLRRHLKTHSGERLNQCNEWNNTTCSNLIFVILLGFWEKNLHQKACKLRQPDFVTK